jgi:hypothetical protein
MNRNTKRRKEAARDAFGRVKHGRGGPADDILAQTVGSKARKSRFASVGRSGPAIAKKLGHHLNSEHQGPR